MKHKILIVDDFENIRKSFRDILECEGYVVEESSNGLDCITKIKEDKTFDLIILDHRMPKMGGMETLEHLQILAPTIPVIANSASGNEEMSKEYIDKGAYAFFIKPPDINPLLTSIKEAIASKINNQ